MGATFSTVFEAAVPPHGTLGADHRALARVRESLDQLAVANGLTSLLEFERYAPEDVAGLMDEEAIAQQPPVEWSPPERGLATVNALWDLLAAHPGVLTKQPAVLDDRSEVGDELEAARRAGVRFRFAVII